MPGDKNNHKMIGPSKVLSILKGGQGSGNFGHSGREGERGGSGESLSPEEIKDVKLNAIDALPKNLRQGIKVKVKPSQQSSMFVGEVEITLKDGKVLNVNFSSARDLDHNVKAALIRSGIKKVLRMIKK